MSYTKATLSDVEAAEAVATDTGAAAAETGDSATDFSTRMESGVEDVTTALRTHFGQVATRMRDEAAAAMTRLGAADWEGNSREMAAAAESSLHRRVDATLASAEQGTDEFRDRLLTQANEFVEGVRGRFATVLGTVDIAYRDLAQAEAAFATNLRQADDTVQFSG